VLCFSTERAAGAGFPSEAQRYNTTDARESPEA